MDLTHKFTVPATVQETWDAFNDIGSVAECFPGAQVTSIEGDTFQGTVKVKLGPIALVYNGTGTFVDKDEATRTMKIEAKGKDKRGNGTAGANVTATMVDNGGQTDVQVVTDLNITGKPAQFGRGVMQDVSDKLLGQFVDCLQTKVGAGAAPQAPVEGAAATPAPATPEPGTSSTEPSAPAPVAPSEPELATPAAPAPAVAPVSSPAPAPAAPAASTKKNDDALDLGATVIPILAKAYWKQAVAALVVVVVVVVVLVAVL